MNLKNISNVDRATLEQMVADVVSGDDSAAAKELETQLNKLPQEIQVDVKEIKEVMIYNLIRNEMLSTVTSGGWFAVFRQVGSELTNDKGNSTYRVGSDKWDFGEPRFWGFGEAAKDTGVWGDFFQEGYMGITPDSSVLPDFKVKSLDETGKMIWKFMEVKAYGNAEGKTRGSGAKITAGPTLEEYINAVRTRNLDEQERLAKKVVWWHYMTKFQNLLIADVEKRPASDTYIKIPQDEASYEWERAGEFRYRALTYYYRLLKDKLEAFLNKMILVTKSATGEKEIKFNQLFQARGLKDLDMPGAKYSI